MSCRQRISILSTHLNEQSGDWIHALEIYFPLTTCSRSATSWPGTEVYEDFNARGHIIHLQRHRSEDWTQFISLWGDALVLHIFPTTSQIVKLHMVAMSYRWGQSPRALYESISFPCWMHFWEDTSLSRSICSAFLSILKAFSHAQFSIGRAALNTSTSKADSGIVRCEHVLSLLYRKICIVYGNTILSYIASNWASTSGLDHSTAITLTSRKKNINHTWFMVHNTQGCETAVFAKHTQVRSLRPSTSASASMSATNEIVLQYFVHGFESNSCLQQLQQHLCRTAGIISRVI